MVVVIVDNYSVVTLAHRARRQHRHAHLGARYLGMPDPPKSQFMEPICAGEHKEIAMILTNDHRHRNRGFPKPVAARR